MLGKSQIAVRTGGYYGCKSTTGFVYCLGEFMPDSEDSLQFHKSQVAPAAMSGIIVFVTGWLALLADVPTWVKVVSWFVLIPTVIVMLGMMIVSYDSGGEGDEADLLK